MKNIKPEVTSSPPVQVTPTHIVVTTTASKRGDTGPYKINVSNRHGKDTAKLNVTVLDAPGKPTGPITATDICGDVSTVKTRLQVIEN